MSTRLARARSAAGVVALALVIASGCSAPPSSLFVQLVTDLVSRREVDRALVVVADAAGHEVDRIEVDLSVARDLSRGVRLSLTENLAPGDYTATVTLSENGTPGLIRVGRRHVEGPTVLTLAMTRSCLGVRCDDPAASACHGGTCVPPTCTEETPEACGMSSCDATRACPSAGIACVTTTCTGSGLCIDAPDDTLCAANERCDPPTGGCRPLILGTNLGEPEDGTATGAVRATGSLTPTFGMSPYGEIPAQSIRVDYGMSCDSMRLDTCSPIGAISVVAPWPGGTSNVRFSMPSPLSVAQPPFQPVGMRYFFRTGLCQTADGAQCLLRSRYLDVGRLRDDFDGDGFSDLLLSTDAGVLLLRGSATGPISPGIVVSSAPGARGIALGDTDADGYADFAILDRTAGMASVTMGGTILGGTLSVSLAASPVTSLVAAGDVDDDGSADILLRTGGTTDAVLVVFAPFTGAAVALERPTDAVAFGTSLAAGDRAGSDGFPDLVVGWTNAAGDRFRRLDLADPSRTFQTGSATPLDGQTVLLVPDVCDDDGTRDYVVADPSANGGSGHVDVYSSVDARPFPQDLTPAIPDAALGSSIASGNANGARRSVLAIGAPGADLVLWIAAPADPPLLVQPPTPGAGPTRFGESIAFHDVDGDGRDELIIAAPGEHAIYVVEPTGDTFTSTRIDVPDLVGDLSP